MGSFHFNPDVYGKVCANLLSSEDLPPLGPGDPQRQVGERLQALTIEELFRDATLRGPSHGVLLPGRTVALV